MPRNFHRKLGILSRIPSYVEFNRAQNGLIAYWDTQVQSGLVAPCFNPALALGRNIVGLTYADYIPEGAEWSNLGSEVAHCDGTQADDSDLSQSGLATIGKTYEITFTLSNHSAGRINVLFGGVVGAARTSDGTYTEQYISITTGPFRLRGNVDFIGDIDLKTVSVKQTGIAASSDFPGTNVIVNPSFSADTDWTKGDAAITIASGKATWSGAQAGNADLTQTVAPLTSGIRYKQFIVLSGVSAGTITPIFGTQAGTALNADGTYPLAEEIANGTAFLLRGDSSFAGSCEIVEIQPANPMNGDITGLSLGIQSGTPLEYLVSSDSINDNLSIDSAELNSLINYSNLYFDMWALSDTWAAGTDYLFNFGIDSNNYFRGYRTGTNLIIEHKAGGTQKSVTMASGSPSGLFHFGGSIDVGNDVITLIYNGLPGGTATGLGTMVGNLNPTETVIGAFDDSGSNSWAGDWGHPTLFNITLSNGDWIRRFEAGGVR